MVTECKAETAAVVVTYNRKALLRQCIAKILSQKGNRCDVVVIDNASTDGTDEMIRQEYSIPEVRYYNTGMNLGGAGGFAYGIKKAVEAGYQYLWIMDDDTLPDENALDELFHADKTLNENWGFLSSVAYWTDGSICQANVQKRNIFQRLKENEYKEIHIPVKMASFVSLLVKTEVVKTVGLPIGEYFIWTDDYEYTGRISRSYPSYVVTSSKVVHAMKVHTRVNFVTANEERMMRYHYLYRNDVHCYRQYGLAGWAYIFGKDLYTTIKLLLYSGEQKKQKIGVLWNGFMEGLSFDPQIEMADGCMRKKGKKQDRQYEE